MFQDFDNCRETRAEDSAHGTLWISEFLSRLLQLRGENPATVKDIVDLRKLIQNQLSQFSHMYNSMNKNLVLAKTKVYHLENQLSEVNKSLAQMREEIQSELGSISSQLIQITKAKQDLLPCSLRNDMNGPQISSQVSWH